MLRTFRQRSRSLRTWNFRTRTARLEALEDRAMMAAGNYLANLINSGLVSKSIAGVASAPGTSPSALVDDSYEENDTRATARNLGTLTGSTTLSNLVMADGADYYSFTITSAATSAHSITMNFTHSQGDLDLRLLNSSGTILKRSEGVSNTETVSLSGLAAGTYFIQAYGYRAVTNPSYSLTINTPGPLADDAYENNDTQATASNLGTLTSATTINSLALADAADWFTFTTTGTGTSSDFVRINFTNSQGNLALELYNAAGTRIGSANGTGNSEQILLTGLTAGTYSVRVLGNSGATNPSYSLTIDPPSAAAADDAYENNDTQATASNLGTLTTVTTINSLALADTADWFTFTTTGTGTSSDFVRINFTNSQGNLALELYNSAGTRLATANGTGNSEQISLSGRAAGTYSARVLGNSGATNPSYSLTIDPPAAAITDDSYENNDTQGAASSLGTLTTATTVSNLMLADTADWYSFTMNGAGTSSDFVRINFTNSQGNLALELYNSSGTLIGSANGTGNSEQINLTSVAAGTYYVRVLGSSGATNPSYSLTVDPGVATTPPPTGGFNIEFAFSGLSSAQQAIFEQAALKWESIIVGDLPNATYNGVVVDDLLIGASSVAIDGVGGVLGQAGPDRLRSGSSLPYHGVMEFDSADMNNMIANGTFLGVILHEMGHVLGIGTIWSSRGLVAGAGTSSSRYIGAGAVAEYNAIFGVTGTSIPLETGGGSGTRDSHWRESLFDTELMTGYVEAGGVAMPISRITVASLADIGYTVNIANADPYTRPGASLVSSVQTTGPTGGNPNLLELNRPALFSSLGDSPNAQAVHTAIHTFLNNLETTVRSVVHSLREGNRDAARETVFSFLDDLFDHDDEEAEEADA